MTLLHKLLAMRLNQSKFAIFVKALAFGLSFGGLYYFVHLLAHSGELPTTAADHWIIIFVTASAALFAKFLLQARSAKYRLRLLEKAIEAAPDGIQVMDLRGNTLYSNKAIQKIFGYLPQDFNGKHLNEMEPGWSGELLVRHADGTTFPIWLTTSVLRGLSDTPIATVGIVRDITKRKNTSEALRRSEEHLLLAHDVAQIGTWDWDLLTGETVMSDRARDFLALPRDTPVSYELALGAIHPDDRGTVDRAVKAALRRKVDFSVEMRIPLSDNTLRWILAKGRGYYNDEGKPNRLIGIVRNLTDRKQLELDLRSAVDARDEFLSIASHELKTPLTALTLQLELMKHEMDKHALSEHEVAGACLLKQALIQVSRLSKLLNDLMNVTRIRAGKFFLEKSRMDLVASAQEAAAALREQATSAGSNILLLAPGPIMGHWDQERICQVFTNLLSNAIKYGNGSRIEVELEEATGVARFRVRDYGLGIPAGMQKKIFKRFERAITGGKITGLGLGLYIVRQIVDAHGGSIQVESEFGKGSTFICELPIQSGE